MPTPTRGFDMLWISERMAINPNSILWVFRGAHGELEITFAGAKQLTLNEHELTSEGRAFFAAGRGSRYCTDRACAARHPANPDASSIAAMRANLRAAAAGRRRSLPSDRGVESVASETADRCPPR